MSPSPRELLLLLDDQPPAPSPVALVRGRLLRRRRRLLSAATAVAVLGTAGGVAAVVQRPAREAAPVAARASTDDRGVRLTLVLPDAEVALGETVRATVTLENLTDRVVQYGSDGCRRLIDVEVDVEAVPEPGRSWDGVEGAFKQLAVRDQRPQRGGFGPRSPDGDADGQEPASFCTSNGLVNDLPAGARETLTLFWSAGLPEGGRPAGPAHVTARFHLVQEPRGPRKEKPVEVQVPLTVRGEGTLSRGEAVDAALADPRFRAWVADQPRSTWSNVFSYRDPSGGDHPGTWTIGLFREGPGVRGAGTVNVDERTGEVDDYSLP